MGNKRKLIIVVILVLVMAGAMALVLGGNKADNKEANGADASSDVQENAVITYTNSGFTPNKITIKRGQIVAVVNDSGSELEFASNDHPVHTDNTDLNVGIIGTAKARAFSTDKTGTWSYHNHLRSSHSGKIIVE